LVCQNPDKGPHGGRNESKSNPDPELLINLSDEPWRKRMLGTMLGTMLELSIKI
jgi:hypothetical protein